MPKITLCIMYQTTMLSLLHCAARKYVMRSRNISMKNSRSFVQDLFVTLEDSKSEMDLASGTLIRNYSFISASNFRKESYSWSLSLKCKSIAFGPIIRQESIIYVSTHTNDKWLDIDKVI